MSVTWHSVLLCEVLLMVAQSCGRRLPPPMIADVKPVSQAAPANPHVTQTEKYFQAEKYFEEGLRLEIAGQYDRALEALEQSVAAGNDYYPAWLHLGRVNLLRDRRAAALMYLEVAVGLRPNDPGALYWRAEANLQLGETRDAIADYGRALQQEKDGLQRSEIYASRAEAYSRLGQGAEALEDYSHAIRWQPGAASVHYRRGLLYRKLGQLQAAMQDFGVALSLRPNYEEARLAQRSVNEMLSPPPKDAAVATIQPTVVQPIAAPPIAAPPIAAPPIAAPPIAAPPIAAPPIAAPPIAAPPIAAPPIAAPPTVTNKPAAATPEVPPKAVRPAEDLYGTARKLIQARREHEAIGELNEALRL
ncbi:MAG TPA: tetratricopeptide repeat protein, partial [Bryobacteraceae bacterium]|nr:tetratricopeptide repeat protein [Bryobacteraceae bacterium]